ncbi:MAG TPA: lysophospholipid acyltransferase family protein [Saprospiraceae bacterium]|nr:lysophospholipid acyltransferase family protein [Saprospiraceae bacterium]
MRIMHWIGYPFGLLLAAIRFLFIMGSMAFFIGIGMILIKLGWADQELAFKVRTWWCRMAIRLFGIRVHVSGRVDLSPGTLYVGNHRLFVDPILAFQYINNGWAVGKMEVSGYPLIHTGAVLSGVVYVERSNSDSRSRAKDAIVKLLSEKKSVLVFPEGTISIDQGALPFRKGSFEAAAETNRPVVAFALEVGDPESDFWYKDGLISQYFKTFSKWRTDMYIHFFDPVWGNDGEALCARVQEMIGTKMESFQKNWKSQP